MHPKRISRRDFLRINLATLGAAALGEEIPSLFAHQQGSEEGRMEQTKGILCWKGPTNRGSNAERFTEDVLSAWLQRFRIPWASGTTRCLKRQRDWQAEWGSPESGPAVPFPEAFWS